MHISHSLNACVTCVVLLLTTALHSSAADNENANILSTNEQLPVLLIGRTLFNQSLDPFDTAHNTKEYVLDPSIRTLPPASAAFEVRISYLGSPAASYTISLLRRSLSSPRGGVSTPTTRRVLLDTERLVFSADDVKSIPLDGVVSDTDEESGSDEIVVRVVTRPWGRRRDGNVVQPGEERLYFNIVVESMVYGVPQKMFPVLLCGVVAVLLSLFVIAPALLKVLQPLPPPTAARKAE